MIIVGIETSTHLGSIAISDEETDRTRILGRISISLSASRSEKLIPYIDFLLDEIGIDFSDIDLIAVSIGPGSFTGLRVSLATAKGLAFSSGIPLIGIDSLMCCAFPFLSNNEKVGAFFDAKRGEVYGAAYNLSSQRGFPNIIIEPSIFHAYDFLNTLIENKIYFVTGDDTLSSYSKFFIDNKINHPNSVNYFPDALSISRLGYLSYKKGLYNSSYLHSPQYLREFIPGNPNGR